MAYPTFTRPRTSFERPWDNSYFAGYVLTAFCFSFARSGAAEDAGLAAGFLRTASTAPATKQPTRKIPRTMSDLPRLPMGLFDRGIPCAGGGKYPG